MTSATVSTRGRSMHVNRHVKEQPETQVARATSYDHQILKPSRSVDDKAVWAARVPRRQSGSEESEAARGRFFEANCGAWVDFG